MEEKEVDMKTERVVHVIEIEPCGVSGWLSWLSIQFLAFAQVMISLFHADNTEPVWNLFLSFFLSAPPLLTSTCTLSLSK